VLAANLDVMLTDPFNLTIPNPVPMGGSPALTGADFTNTNLLDAYFTPVTYKGAFGTENWLLNWTNFTPNQSGYTGIENIKTISSANIYPNPMKSTSTLAFSITESNQVRIAITDLSGREVSEVLNTFMVAGNHNVNINVPGLISGMYFLLIQSGDNNQMIKLSVE
jgi:hypothetical protein